jgi:hypothetical protein
MIRLRSTLFAGLALLLSVTSTPAQQPVSRLKGRIVTDKGEPVKDAEVRAEAFFGAAAGTFAGQRTFSTRTNDKGAYSILGIAPGIWLFEVIAPGHAPEIVVLPIRLLTASSPNAAGQMLPWDLVLKPVPVPAGDQGGVLNTALDAALAKKPDEVNTLLSHTAEGADADYLAAAGRVAVVARQMNLAYTLFHLAGDRDPASYRATLGLASLALLQRDFDTASRGFDAARNRTHDKDEQRFISAAIGDLATIKFR